MLTVIAAERLGYTWSMTGSHRRNGDGRGAEGGFEESHVVAFICRQLSRELLRA